MHLFFWSCRRNVIPARFCWFVGSEHVLRYVFEKTSRYSGPMSMWRWIRCRTVETMDKNRGCNAGAMCRCKPTTPCHALQQDVVTKSPSSSSISTGYRTVFLADPAVFRHNTTLLESIVPRTPCHNRGYLKSFMREHTARHSLDQETNASSKTMGLVFSITVRYCFNFRLVAL